MGSWEPGAVTRWPVWQGLTGLNTSPLPLNSKGLEMVASSARRPGHQGRLWWHGPAGGPRAGQGGGELEPGPAAPCWGSSWQPWGLTWGPGEPRRVGRVSQSPVCALRPCLCSLYENKIYLFFVVIAGNGCRAFLSKPLIQNPKHVSTASETTAIPVMGGATSTTLSPREFRCA